MASREYAACDYTGTTSEAATQRRSDHGYLEEHAANLLAAQQRAELAACAAQVDDILELEIFKNANHGFGRKIKDPHRG